MQGWDSSARRVYAGAREKRGDEAGFIAEMAKHWATDPKYAEKLLTVLGEVKELENEICGDSVLAKAMIGNEN